MKRGDLYFCKPPGFVGKVRPAVVVQSDEFNQSATSVTLCLLTSHIVDSKLRVTIDPTPDNRLEKRSPVMIDKVMTLPVGGAHAKFLELLREVFAGVDRSAWHDLKRCRS